LGEKRRISPIIAPRRHAGAHLSRSQGLAKPWLDRKRKLQDGVYGRPPEVKSSEVERLPEKKFGKRKVSLSQVNEMGKAIVKKRVNKLKFI